jgi:peptidylprolyl isomerase
VLSTAGCGGGTDSSSTLSYRPFSLPASSVAKKQERTARTWLRPDKNGLVGAEPKPVIPDRPPPEFVVAVDLIDSFSVPVSDDGDRLTVQYVGYRYGSKQKFGSSWDEGRPLTFTLGKGEVVQGWEEGLKRMEIGDRREVVVPPEYVTGGRLPHGLPANSTLVFVVEALAVDES